MPICVVGMHRSGTSLFMQMLSRCGVYTGENKLISKPAGVDNPTGYWEHPDFQDINDRILQRLGGTWKTLPLFGENWADNNPGIQRLKDEAGTLISQFDNYELWGWKDPRNSLTIPFWHSIIPDLKFVIMFRNPIQVAMSLQTRLSKGTTRPEYAVTFHDAMELWLAYYDQIWNALDTEPVYPVVNYEALLYAPAGELQRILEILDISVDQQHIEQATRTANSELWRSAGSEHVLHSADLPQQFLNTYEKLGQLAGSNYQRMQQDEAYQQTRRDLDVVLLYQKLKQTWASDETFRREVLEKSDRQKKLWEQRELSALRVFTREITVRHKQRIQQAEQRQQDMEQQLRQSQTHLGQTQEQLHQSQAQLGQTQEQLHQSQDQLHQSQDQLHQSQAQLGQTQEQLHQSQAQLGQTQEQLHQSQAQLGQTQEQLHQSQAQLGQTQEHLQETQTQFQKTQTQLRQQKVHTNQLYDEIQTMKNTRAWKLSSAYWKVRDFLLKKEIHLNNHLEHIKLLVRYQLIHKFLFLDHWKDFPSYPF